MGLIKEPKGVDLLVGPSVLTEKDKQFMSAVIADYKKTGKMPSKSSSLRVRDKVSRRLNPKITPRSATQCCRYLQEV